MSRIRRVTLITCILLASQVLRLFFENWYLVSNNSNVGSMPSPVSHRVVPSSVELGDGFLVNRFYKTEGFGVGELDPNDVTLATHGTIDKLYRLIELAEVWSGPISMAVFAPLSDASFLDDAIDGLRLCWSTLRKNVSFHLIHSKASPANVTKLGSFVYLSCKDIIRRLRLVKPVAEKSQYPHNLMRNVARSGVMTNFVLHIDADLVPTPSLRNKFREFITKNNLYSRSAARSSMALYVLPVFELRQFQTPVRSKQDLITAINARNARTFLQETCLQCHQPTNYDKWQQESKNATGLSYKVDYVKEWAPFFIAPRFSPMFDERFTSFGHDNLAHMCELQANGYHFYVLNDEFLICNGYRSKNKLTEFERKRRDSRDSFYEGFLQKLRNNGYVGSMYNNCYE